MIIRDSLTLVPIVSASRLQAELGPKEFILKEYSAGAVASARLGSDFEATAVQTISWRGSSDATLEFSRDAAYEGVYLFSYLPRGDERFTVSGGLVYSRSSGRPQVLPAAGLLYESRDRSLFAEIGFPSTNVLFRRDQWEFGGYFDADVAAYRVSDTTDPGSRRSGDRIRIMRFDVGPEITRRIGGSLYATLRAGLRLVDRSELLASDGRDVIERDAASGAGWTSGISLSWRP